MIEEVFRDKTVLVTGTTGFLGKVVLEKIMFSVRNFKKMYLLIRPKKDALPIERLEKDILSSE